MQVTVPAQLHDGADPIAEIGAAMCRALDQGNAVVFVASGPNRQLLETQLQVRGINVVEALRTGRYVSLDALETLSTIMTDDHVDVIRFAEVIGAPIDRAAKQHGCVLIFGDLIPSRHAAGKHTGAIELNNLLQSLIASRPIFRDCR